MPDNHAGVDPSGFLQGLRPEARLLLTAAHPQLTLAQQEWIHAFLSNHRSELDWGFFVDQACRHGVLPLIGRNLVKLRLVHTDQGRTLAPYRWIYSYVYEGNRRRNIALADEYAKVLRGLHLAGIRYAIRKGPVLCDGVYRDVGLRRMGDLDLLLSPAALPAFVAVVTELGYQQGHLSRNAERVVAFDRRTQLVWKVNLTNSTLPFLKPAQRDDVEAFVLDPCFNLFQPHSGITTDAAGFLARTVPTTAFGEPTMMLDPLDQVVDACVQLHVEATTLMYIELGKDLTVLKFLDLALLVSTLTDLQIEGLVERIREYGCEASAFYALHHTALLYPAQVPWALVAAFSHVGRDILDGYGQLDGAPQRWDRGFAERLFDPARARSLPVRSSVPGPRAVV